MDRVGISREVAKKISGHKTDSACRRYNIVDNRDIEEAAKNLAEFLKRQYICCDVDAARDVNVCTVWNDFTGSAEEKGEYRLLREHRAAAKEELQFRWADLKDDKVLDNLNLKHPR